MTESDRQPGSRSEQVASGLELAEDRIRKADSGDVLAAKRILKEVDIALGDIVGGRRPDRERLVYLKWLRAALQQIASGVLAKKALGLYSIGAPKSVAVDRDWRLFCAVGVEYNRTGRVKLAVKKVSEMQNAPGVATIEKAWQACGGLKAWRGLGIDLNTSTTAEQFVLENRLALERQINSLPPGNRTRRKLEMLLSAKSTPKTGN